jgi:hypothetical protein
MPPVDTVQPGSDPPVTKTAVSVTPAFVIQPQPRIPQGKPAFLDDVHSLRGLAIIFIVSGHCLPLFNWEHPHSYGGWLHSLLPNGTVFFMFIAGLLFQHLSARFHFSDYLKKKFRNVMLPYLVLSLPITFHQALFSHGGVFSPASPYHSSSGAVNAVFSLLTGFHILAPFWFIPMMSIFYLLAPVFLWIDRNQSLYRFLPVMLLVTVLVHRPSNVNHVWQSTAYFAPVYIYGMWFGRNRERAMAWHQRWLGPLVVVIAALTWSEVMILHRPGYIASGMFSTDHGVIDTNAIQKLLLCGVLLVALRHAGRAATASLRYPGDLAFGVFFLHMIVIWAYQTTGFGTPLSSLYRFGLTAATTICICILCLWCTQRVFGRYSRSIVGC